MTEAELLELAGQYRKARTDTSHAARVGLKALSDLRLQGVDIDIIKAALDAHLGPFRAPLAAKADALLAVQLARTA